MNQWIRWALLMIPLFLVLVTLVIFLVNWWIISSTQEQIVDVESVIIDPQESQVPILVLGAGVIDAQTPSNILAKRLDTAIALHTVMPKAKMIMSGDHQTDFYDEVTTMKNYVVKQGVASQQVYLDHAGYSTYDSLFRLKNVFHVDQVIIVTQRYHLHRALFIANQLGIQAIGVEADEYPSTRFVREAREVFARLKEFTVLKLHLFVPTVETNYAIDLTVSGDLSNDKEKVFK